jgi:hypothetical protein
MSDTLGQIQALQFSDRAAAERLLIGFLRDTLHLDVLAVELRPLAVSLNSFNGFMTLADGRRLFFKTHIEADGILNEYYHAGQLAEAGYPVLQPIYSSTEAGKQLLIYEVISDPSVFDVAWAIEQGDPTYTEALTAAQRAADDHLLAIYQQSLDWQTGEAAAQSPVHQLFYHRLTGGRLARFYDPAVLITLPDGTHTMDDVRRARWIINGQQYAMTLDDLIAQAIRLLQPDQPGASVIGHGDAHNGNVFFRGSSLLYFDPAFAGRHHPLLDLTKPLFHNVFAMWMYHPQLKAAQTNIQLERGGAWRVRYDYALHPIRHMFLRSKVERVLIPVLQTLKRRGWLPETWRAYLKSALFCCPFLTMNLTDAAKFPPAISLLGLAMSVEMGAESAGERSLIDQTLDEAERALT